MSLYGFTFHVTIVYLCIIFQCNLYISCIMSCGNKIVSKNCFKIVLNCFKNCFKCNCSTNLAYFSIWELLGTYNIFEFFARFFEPSYGELRLYLLRNYLPNNKNCVSSVNHSTCLLPSNTSR